MENKSGGWEFYSARHNKHSFWSLWLNFRNTYCFQYKRYNNMKRVNNIFKNYILQCVKTVKFGIINIGFLSHSVINEIL